MEWKTVLAYITGTVDQELLLRNEYLVAENRILRNQITGRVRLTDGERTTLAALGKRLGKQAVPSMKSSALKYLSFLDTTRLDEFFDHTRSSLMRLSTEDTNP